MPVKRALLALLLCAACSLRNPRVDSQSCASSRECRGGDVCFLGECRGNAAALATVIVEVRPPGDGRLAALRQVALDLRQSVVHDFALSPPAQVTGTVVQRPNPAGSAPTPVAGATVSFVDSAPALPDRIEFVSALTDSSGNYAVSLPARSWSVRVEPAAPLPPAPAAYDGGVRLDLQIPAAAELVTTQVALQAPLPLQPGFATAVDSEGQPLSASAETGDGGFALVLPPGTPRYYLQVGPGSSDGGVGDPFPSYDGLGPYDAGVPAQVALPLPPAATLTGKVVDRTGAPVAAARVYARSEGMPFNLQRSTTAGADGAYALTLRTGSYLVEAAPALDPSAPAVSGVQTVTVSGPTTLDLTCPDKTHAFGTVLRPDGSTAPSGWQVSATRRADGVLSSRTAYTTVTGAGGVFHLIGDPGTYGIEVVPPQQAGLPRKLVQADVPPASSLEVPLPTVQVSPPVTVVGVVHGAPAGGTDAPVAGASVEFYALDASGTRSVFLGSGVTDAKGRYQAIVPDVEHPAPPMP